MIRLLEIAGFGKKIDTSCSSPEKGYKVLSLKLSTSLSTTMSAASTTTSGGNSRCHGEVELQGKITRTAAPKSCSSSRRSLFVKMVQLGLVLASAPTPVQAKYAGYSGSAGIAPQVAKDEAAASSCKVCAGLSNEDCKDTIREIVSLTAPRGRLQLMTGFLRRMICEGLGDKACERATDKEIEALGWDKAYAHIRGACDRGEVVLSSPAQMNAHRDEAGDGSINEEWLTAWRVDCAQCLSFEEESDTVCASALYSGFLRLPSQSRLNVISDMYPAHNCATVVPGHAMEECYAGISSMITGMSQVQKKGLMLHSCARNILPEVRQSAIAPTQQTLVGACSVRTAKSLAASLSVKNRMEAYQRMLPAVTCNGLDESQCLSLYSDALTRWLPTLSDKEQRRSVCNELGSPPTAPDASAAIRAAVREWEGALAQRSDKPAIASQTDSEEQEEGSDDNDVDADEGEGVEDWDEEDDEGGDVQDRGEDGVEEENEDSEIESLPASSCSTCENLSDVQCRDVLDLSLQGMTDFDRLGVYRYMFPSSCSSGLSDSACMEISEAEYLSLSDKDRLAILESTCEMGLLGAALLKSSYRRQALLLRAEPATGADAAINIAAPSRGTSIFSVPTQTTTLLLIFGVISLISCMLMGALVGKLRQGHASNDWDYRTIPV